MIVWMSLSDKSETSRRRVIDESEDSSPRTSLGRGRGRPLWREGLFAAPLQAVQRLLGTGRVAAGVYPGWVPGDGYPGSHAARVPSTSVY